MNNGADRLATAATGHKHTAPTAAQVISLVELNGAPLHAEPQAAPVLDNANPLHAVRTKLQVCVGETEVSIGELMGAREHQVLLLDRGLDQPVDLLLEGKVVARGQLMAVEGRFALQITELPLPLRP